MDLNQIRHRLSKGYQRINDMKNSISQVENCRASLKVKQDSVLEGIRCVMTQMQEKLHRLQNSMEASVIDMVTERERQLDAQKTDIHDSYTRLVQVCVEAEKVLKGRHDAGLSYQRLVNSFEAANFKLDAAEKLDVEGVTSFEFQSNMKPFLSSTYVARLLYLDRHRRPVDVDEFWLDIPENCKRTSDRYTVTNHLDRFSSTFVTTHRSSGRVPNDSPRQPLETIQEIPEDVHNAHVDRCGGLPRQPVMYAGHSPSLAAQYNEPAIHTMSRKIIIKSDSSTADQSPDFAKPRCVVTRKVVQLPFSQRPWNGNTPCQTGADVSSEKSLAPINCSVRREQWLWSADDVFNDSSGSPVSSDIDPSSSSLVLSPKANCWQNSGQCDLSSQDTPGIERSPEHCKCSDLDCSMSSEPSFTPKKGTAQESGNRQTGGSLRTPLQKPTVEDTRHATRIEGKASSITRPFSKLLDRESQSPVPRTRASARGPQFVVNVKTEPGLNIEPKLAVNIKKEPVWTMETEMASMQAKPVSTIKTEPALNTEKEPAINVTTAEDDAKPRKMAVQKAAAGKAVKAEQEAADKTRKMAPEVPRLIKCRNKRLDLSCMLEYLGESVFVHARCIEKIQGDFSHPIGVCTNSRGDVIVADTGNNVIKVCSNSRVIHTFGANCKMRRPSAVVVNENDEIFVKDDQCVFHFDSQGQLIKLMGKRMMTSPYGLAMIQSGSLVVVDALPRNARLHVLQQDGTMESFPFQPLFPQYQDSKCRFLAVHGQHLLTSDLGRSCLYLTSLEGELHKTLGRRGKWPGELHEPAGLATDSVGNWLVADSKNHRVQVYAQNGYYMATLQLSGDSIRRPSGIHLTSDGLLYVINYIESVIKVFKLETV